MIPPNCIHWQTWVTNWIICFWMTTRQVISLGHVRQFRQEGGVMTYATERAPCTSAVRGISFKLLFRASYCCLWPPFLLGSIFPYLDIRPSLDFLLSYFITCSFFFYRLGHRRRLGCARRCSTTPRYLKY